MAIRDGTVPGLSKSGSGLAEQETSRYPAAAKVSSQLPGRWARAGTAWRRRAARGGALWAWRGGTGRGEASRAAPPGGRRRGRVAAGLWDAGRGGKRSWETGFTTAGKPGGRGAEAECGSCAVAPGSPALPLARRRSTLGALA